MLIEIFECLECHRRLVKIGSEHLKAHNCPSTSVKLLADAEVSMLRLRTFCLNLIAGTRSE